MPKLSEIAPRFRTKYKAEAIKQILDGEKNQSEVAREMGVTRQAVSIWMRDYVNNNNQMPERQKPGRKKGIRMIQPKNPKWLRKPPEKKDPDVDAFVFDPDDPNTPHPKMEDIPTKLHDEFRERAIKQVLDSNRDKGEIAEELGVSPQAVTNWVKDYVKNGNKMPTRAPRGRPKRSRLDKLQMRWLYKTMTERKPQEFDFPSQKGDMWTIQQLSDAFLQEFSIRIAPQTIATYAQNWQIGEPHLTLPERQYTPQYKMWDQELGIERKPDLSFLEDKEDSPEGEEGSIDESWHRLDNIDYEAELKKMKEKGVNWETLYDNNDPRAKTGKHRKQTASAKSKKRKPRPKANNRKKNKKKKR